MEEKNKHLKIDSVIIDLITEYHDTTHSQVMDFFVQLMNETITYEPNVITDTKKPRLLFHKQGKPIYKTVRIAQPGKPDLYSKNNINAWVVRGFYPETKVPFKMSVVVNKGYTNTYCTTVTFGHKNDMFRVNMNDVQKYQEECADAILLDKSIKEIEQVPYKKKVFRCMKPKGMGLLSKGK